MPRRAHTAAPMLLALGVAFVPLLIDTGAHSPRAATRRPSAWKRVLALPHARTASAPELAFDPAGNGFVVWTRADSGVVQELGHGARALRLRRVTAAARGGSYLAFAGLATRGEHAVADIDSDGRPRVSVVDRGAGPLALTDYMTGETALATIARNLRVLLRVRPAHRATWTRSVALARSRWAVTHLAVALDWRGDALVAFAQGSRIYVRERHANGSLGRLQLLRTPRGTVTALSVLVSDDGRGIVAWQTVSGATSRTMLAISAPHVRFTGMATTLEVEPVGVNATLRLLRLSTGRVLVAWTGAAAGRPVVHLAPVSVAGPLPGLTRSGELCDLTAGPGGDAEVLWAAGGSLRAARGLDIGLGVAVLAPGEAVAPGATCADATVAVRPTDDVPAVAWRDGRGALRVALRPGPPQSMMVGRSSTTSSTPSSSPTRQTSSLSSSTSTHAPAENGKTT